METATKTMKIQKNGTDVFITDEYELFKTKLGNRPINHGLVLKLYNSILEHGYFKSSIIIVGDNLVVLDGQHRIEALKMFAEKYGIRYKARYVVDRDLDDLKKITVLQTARQGWTNEDFTQSYIAQGNVNYKIYSEFRAKHRFKYNKLNHKSTTMNHSVALSLLANSNDPGNLNGKFKAGKIKIVNIDISNKFAERLTELSEYYSYATHSVFVRVMIKMWNNPLFDHNEFVRKLSRDRNKLYRVSSLSQYVQIIEEIYNFGRRQKIKF